MNFSPLQLIRYITPEFSCKAVDHFDPNKPLEIPDDTFEVATSVNRIDKPEQSESTLWTIELRIHQEVKADQNFPYEFRMAMVGFFTFSDGSPEGFDHEHFLQVNGSTVLYGVAREILRTMTARGPWEELLLPTLSFYEKKEPPALASE